MSENESVECMKHLLAAERLLAAANDLAALAQLSPVLDRLKDNHPDARQLADTDEHHLALDRAVREWAGLLD